MLSRFILVSFKLELREQFIFLQIYKRELIFESMVYEKWEEEFLVERIAMSAREKFWLLCFIFWNENAYMIKD